CCGRPVALPNSNSDVGDGSTSVGAGYQIKSPLSRPFRGVVLVRRRVGSVPAPATSRPYRASDWSRLLAGHNVGPERIDFVGAEQPAQGEAGSAMGRRLR